LAFHEKENSRVVCVDYQVVQFLPVKTHRKDMPPGLLQEA